MTNFKSAALFGALVGALTTPVGSLRAAPDNTLGMALMSATVQGNGSLVHGSGAVSSGMGNLGIYTVTFERPLSACSCTATAAALQAGAHATNIVATANCQHSANTVGVATTLVSGGAIGSPFHLIVYCPR